MWLMPYGINTDQKGEMQSLQKPKLREQCSFSLTYQLKKA
jgi:hypothetical protein